MKRHIHTLKHEALSRRVHIVIMLQVLLVELFLCALVPPPAVQAQSRDLKWTTIDKPGRAGNVVITGSDVSEIAIGGSLFYVLDTTQSKIYRSQSGGLRWEDITSYLGAAGATLPATKIAIAPDAASIVAVAADGGTALYLSVDGGITWGNMHLGGLSGTTIQSIAISKSYGERNEQRDILVGTAKFGDNLTTGKVLLLHLGSIVPVWKDLKIKVDPNYTGGDVSAVAFSPSYTDDWTIAAIASTGADVASGSPPDHPDYRNRTFLCIGTEVDALAGTVKWNDNANWPIEIPKNQSAGDDTGRNINGGLAISSNFAATITSGKSPLVYAFYTINPAPVSDPSNVYQIDTWVPTVIPFTGHGSKRYSSIALSGVRLLAGETAAHDALTVAVRISLNANTTTPVFSNSGYPYGQSNAKVAWSGINAYCGTSGAESGFSISNDNGAHWSQVGLIDTTVAVQDVAVASSPQSIFLTSTSTSNIESVWRSAGEPLGQYWGRVLATDVLSNKLVTRISPRYRDDYTLYVSEVATDLPVITSFTANPSTIFNGSSSTLQWNVTGATSVSINQGIGAVGSSGTHTVSPGTTTTYTISATNSFTSVPVTATVTVSVLDVPPIITEFKASPRNILPGGSSTLSWNVSGATSVFINQGIGDVTVPPPTYPVPVTPAATTTYTLIATNGNFSVSSSVTVRVTAPGLPSIIDFSNDSTLSPLTINAATPGFPLPVKLKWNVTGATVITIDQGIGDVTSVDPPEKTVNPDKTTTYTLTATNGAGSVTASVTITVIPVITSFTANPYSIDVGRTSTLQWTVTGATSVSISPGIGTFSSPFPASQIVSPSTTTRYTLTANYGSGSITAFTTVTVSPQFWVSHDRGNAWKQRNAPPGIIDLAVAEKMVCYVALPDGGVAKSDTAGQFWKNPAYTNLPDITMLSVTDPDTVLVGGKEGDVSYSSNGGASYTRIPQQLINKEPVQVIADSRYRQNSFIYAGCGNTIYRRALGKDDFWDSIRTIEPSKQISGLVSVEGILYALWYTKSLLPPYVTSPSGAERSLNAASPLVSLEWDTLLVGAEAAKFNVTPTALRYTVTDTCAILWTTNSPGTADSLVMVYFDCLAWRGPDLTLTNNAIIGCDPATGRNQEVNFTWNDICADNRYQLQIAKDNKFTLMVFDSGNSYPFLLPVVNNSPALVYFASGGSTSPTLNGIRVPELECGHRYFWRVRARAAVTGDIIRSPWSEVRDFTIKAGFRVTTPYYGPQLLAPDNGCGCPCNTPAAFSWAPFKETTEYRFELSLNHDMTAPLVSTTVKTTAYQYRGQLKCNTVYFWRVMAVKPAPSEWSTVFSFKVLPEQVVTPTAPATGTTTAAPAIPVLQAPLWVWVVIGLFGSLLVAVLLLVLLFKGGE